MLHAPMLHHKSPAYTVDEWQDRGNFFEHNGHNIFYIEAGAGDPLLLIHGFPTSSFDWNYVWNDLSRRYRVIAPDLIGYGFSAKPKGYAYSIMDQADLCEGLLRHLGIATAGTGILAHDYGDTVAQELLARHEDWKFICFLNGGIMPESHRPRLIQKLLLSPIGFLVTRLITERTFRKNFAAVFGPNTQPSDAELKDFWRLIEHNDGVRVYHLLIRYITERHKHRERWVEPLRSSKVPLRLIDGPEDPVSGRHLAERYREYAGEKADVVLLDGIGHYPQTEAPEDVLKAFFEFVERL